MDYTKYTKEELIELVKEGRHLKTAVEAKDKEINELKAKLEDTKKNLKDKYENEIENLKKKLKETESNIEILADKKLSDIKSSYERNENQLRLDAKGAVEVAVRRSKELEEAIDIIKSMQRAFQGSLDMSISLMSYFEDKVMRGE